MRRAAGQVARTAHRVAHYGLGAMIVVLLALAALGWRLAQGPIELAFVARAIEAAYNTDVRDTRLDVGHATIAWEGLHGEGMTPLELRLTEVRLRGRDGALRAELPDGAVSLSIPWLLRGEIAPRRVELRQPVVRLRRDEGGRLSARIAGPAAEPGPDGTALEELLENLMRPPHDGTPMSALAEVKITGARVFVEDAAIGAAWSLEDVAVDLRRLPAGGISGRGSGTLQLGGTRVRLTGTAEIHGQPAEVALRLTLPDIRPAALANLAPQLAPLAGLDAPARVEATARLGTDGVLRSAGAVLSAGRGVADLGAGRRIPIAALEVQADWADEALRVPRAMLRLDGPGTPVLTATAEARRTEGRWRARGTLGLDAVPLAELSRWWPAGLGTGERAWILENITAGTARNGAWQAEAEAEADFTGLKVTGFTGTLDVADATVHWLRPIPPVEGARGQIGFSLAEVSVRVTGAQQSGTQLQARDSTLRFLFPIGATATTEMQIGLAGPVPDVVALVQHPRLRLFDRRPFPVKDPQGTMEGRITIGFPLTETVPIEQLRLQATAQLRQMRLPDILLGRALERGTFDLSVDNDGLRVNGTATLADIQARLGVEMDFRAGNANQVVMRETVQARADARQLAALGLAHEDVVRGPVGLDVRTERRRGGQARATVRAELRDATLAIEPFGYTKPAGQNAGGEAVLRLAGESVEAIESFRLEAPSLLLRGNVAFGRGTRLERVVITEAQIEASRFSGDARPPARPDAPWTIALRGPVLDLRRRLAEETPAGRPGAAAGPSVNAEARFERVLLGTNRELAALDARLHMGPDGAVREGRVTGRAGPRGTFEGTVTPQAQGRALRLTAEDAGALLSSFNVLPHLEGGRLTVSATYAHPGPGAPLVGSAELDDFQIRNAPGFAKVLQAMTLFGLLEALSGPGLVFTRMVAPFTLTPETLTLDDARAFSASLGLTARGTLDRKRQRLAMEGTIVPAYMFNSLLGNIPLLGRVFSPEVGGGLFAATFRMQGPLDDPQVSVNPLAALTPGFLRGLFGIGQSQP